MYLQFFTRNLIKYRFSAASKLDGITGIHVSATVRKKRKTAEEKKLPRMLIYPPKGKVESVDVWRNMTVKELADVLKKDVEHVFEAMSFIDDTGYYNKPSSIIDNPEVIREVVRKSGVKCRTVKPPHELDNDVVENKDVKRQPPAPENLLKKRPPVVTVMGHVDHGKTSLLDALRNTRVVDSEFGGITQHIGAFSVALKSGEKITFLDTPGHAAFSTMRERGANVTDVVVLVVAADDGVMEQTIESIRMANNAKVPMIVAVNKMDKPTADIERTKKMLIKEGVLIEEVGGDVQVVPVSAVTGYNLDLLSEAIVLQAELMGLKADHAGFVEGVVLESRLDTSRGKLSTVIIQRGTLRKGKILVSGTAWAKVRAMFDDQGRLMEEAPPSSAVQIIGWRELPDVGEEILEVESERRAQEVIKWRQGQEILKKQLDDLEVIKKKEQAHLVEYKSQLETKRKLGKFKLKRSGPREKEIKEDDGGPRVNIIIKGDVTGSVEAILDVLDTYDCSNQCLLDVVHYGVGIVSENDLELATAFNAVIYAFNTKVPSDIKQAVKSSGINLREFNVIYKLIDDLKKEISEKLPPKKIEDVIGEGKVQQIFLINEGRKKVPVAGSRCTRGELKKNALFKVIRDNETIYKGNAVSMKHLKNEVGTVKRDVECGIMFEGGPELETGDTIVCYQLVDEPQQTSWNPGF